MRKYTPLGKRFSRGFVLQFSDKNSPVPRSKEAGKDKAENII
jgi:hypothetical protein